MKRHLPQSHDIEMFLMVSKTKASRLQRCLASPCRHYLLVLAEEDDRKGLRGLSEPVVLSRSSSRAPVVPLRISEPAGTRPRPLASMSWVPQDSLARLWRVLGRSIIEPSCYGRGPLLSGKPMPGQCRPPAARVVLLEHRRRGLEALARVRHHLATSKIESGKASRSYREPCRSLRPSAPSGQRVQVIIR